MTILEFFARTFSPPLPDGRFVFRPWGARGPCYVLTPAQRRQRARALPVFYVLALAALWTIPDAIGTPARGMGFALGFMLLHYLLYWLFSLGLQTTDKPPRPTPDQRRAALAEHSRALGRPVLWIFLILSWIFILGGVFLAADGDWLTGLTSILFFGACAAMFTRQLWMIRQTRGPGPG